jgi:hypothetical protein
VCVCVCVCVCVYVCVCVRVGAYLHLSLSRSLFLSFSLSRCLSPHTQITEEALEKTFGGNTSTSYYYYSAHSTSAYMLMYRRVDPARNRSAWVASGRERGRVWVGRGRGRGRQASMSCPSDFRGVTQLRGSVCWSLSLSLSLSLSPSLSLSLSLARSFALNHTHRLVHGGDDARARQGDAGVDRG